MKDKACHMNTLKQNLKCHASCFVTWEIDARFMADFIFLNLPLFAIDSSITWLFMNDINGL